MALPSELMGSILRTIETALKRDDFGPKIKERLGLIKSNLIDLIETTKELEDLVVLDSREKELPNGMEGWARFSPGPQKNAKALLAFVRSSTLLDGLFRKGIDIHNVYKFSDDEIRLARRVGDKFSEFSESLSSLRRSRKSEEKGNERTALLPCSPESGELVKLFQSSKILSFKKFLIRKDNLWKPFKIEWFTARQDASVLGVFETKNAELFRFFQGEWLNAYVYNIVQDHFSRNQAVFELYTNVSYRAPADVIRVAGEFDVIGRFGSRVICVECKSGRLLNEPETVPSIVAKISDLKKAIDFVGGGPSDFAFYLVFDPTQNNEEELQKLLANSELKALRPDQVRAEITRMF